MHQSLNDEGAIPFSKKPVKEKHVISRLNAFDSALIVENVREI